MKKLLQLSMIILLLPGYLFAQISIKDTPYTLLTEAVAAALPGDTIEIVGPVTLTEQVSFNHVTGTKTIRGMSADASIKLANGARFILEAAGETAFSDITLIGADEANPDWGAILTLFNGPTLTLKNDTIRGAKTDAHAGAIRITSGATVKATKTVFRDNQSNQNGGVAFIEAGNTETVFDGCVFINNKCGTNNPDAKGGALFYAQGANEKDHIVKNSAFINNESSNHGGAVGMETVSPKFINCTFSGNKAVDNGGVIWMWNGSGQSKTTVVNCTFYGNIAANGGALFGNQATSLYDVANSVFTEHEGTTFGFAEPITLSIKNSFIPALPDGVTNTGTNNISEGELFLDDINIEEGIFYYDVTSYESVLIRLGNTNLLKPYSRTDQIGFERNMNLSTVTAGSIEYSGEGDPIMGIGNRGEQLKITAYPNPTADFIYINASHAGKIVIYNSNGTVVSSGPVRAGENKIDISGLQNSVYFIQNVSGKRSQAMRFIKK
jgi:hypothetical protein